MSWQSSRMLGVKELLSKPKAYDPAYIEIVKLVQSEAFGG